MMQTAGAEPWKVLIVDDDSDVHDITQMALNRLVYEGRSLRFFNAYSAAEAIHVLENNADIAVVLLDVVMENDTAGLDLVKKIRQDMDNHKIRIIVRTGNPGMAPEESVTLNYDINDYRGKTELTAQSLRTVIITALRSYHSLLTITDLKQELDETQRELIYSLGEIAESRSTENGNHVRRVGNISAYLAMKLGFSEKETDLIHLAASMHDIGKLAIDERILNKPGKLTAEEYECVKYHCVYGYQLLKNSNRDLLKTAAIIAYEHHENYDGSGYPRGLAAEEIHLYSRIVALVDVFDALMHNRVYKEPWPEDKVLDYIREQRGIKFDPVIVDIFMEHYDAIRAIIKEFV